MLIPSSRIVLQLAFLIAGIAFLFSVPASAELVVSNAYYELRLNDAKTSIAITSLATGEQPSAVVNLNGKPSRVLPYKGDSPQLGAMQGLVIVYENGSSEAFTLSEKMPFVAVRKTISNQTDKQQVFDTVNVVDLELNFDTPTKELMTRGTDGLKPLGERAGSYVFSSIADPKTGSGAVLG